jgi:uncharacterized protein (TIGR02285 family)
MRKPTRSAALILALTSSAATATPALKLQIVRRPPYLVIEANGDVSGTSVHPTIAAFKKAGITVEWEPVPALRQLQRLKDNKERVCSVGWYRTREREQFAKFSHAVSQDAPWVGFANTAFAVPKNATVQAILADTDVTVLLKKGYVYGDYLDQQLAAMKAQRKETTSDVPEVIKMIARGRAHITFAPADEIQYYLQHQLVSGADIKIIPFREMPTGYKRYLMCSMLVEDETIARFNAALASP